MGRNRDIGGVPVPGTRGEMAAFLSETVVLVRLGELCEEKAAAIASLARAADRYMPQDKADPFAFVDGELEELKMLVGNVKH